MPKLIKDIEKKILNSAEKLFYEYEYAHISMRMIAKDSGIAVGTIYNYYNDKESLFLKLLTRNWTESYHRIVQVARDFNDPKVALKKFFDMLFVEIEKKKVLGREIMMTSNMSAQKNHTGEHFVSFNQMEKKLLESFLQAISPLLQQTDKTQESVSLFLDMVYGAFIMLMKRDYDLEKKSLMLTDLIITYAEFGKEI